MRLVNSRALRAASRALAASTTFSTIRLASRGFSSRNAESCSPTVDSTQPRTSEETSFSLVWLENFGSCTLTETIATRPSRMSSPESFSFRFLPRPEEAT